MNVILVSSLPTYRIFSITIRYSESGLKVNFLFLSPNLNFELMALFYVEKQRPVSKQIKQSSMQQKWKIFSEILKDQQREEENYRGYRKKEGMHERSRCQTMILGEPTLGAFINRDLGLKLK